MSESIIPITMPKLGLSMTEGAVVEWRVAPGDAISSGDVIADIETSKIVNELEAQSSGIFRRGVVDIGVEVPVGALIGVASTSDVPDADIDAYLSVYSDDSAGADEPETSPTGSASVVAPSETPQKDTPDAGVPKELMGSYDAQHVFATHHAHKFARLLGIDLRKISGTGRGSRISKKDIEAAVNAADGYATAAVPARTSGTVKITPAARRLAKQHGIDPGAVPATGSRGRVSKGDVLAYIKRQEGQSTVAASPATELQDNPYKEKALSSTRKTIARRLSMSKSTAPHFRLSVDLIVDKLLELRKDINADGARTGVSINDMLIRAVALALADNPSVNIQFDGEHVREYAHADVAVAVALDDGLVTPIIRHADKKDLLAISAELAGATERARTGKLLPDDLEGGTFTVSNLGMFGVKSFDAIINPPQAAILAIGRAERRLYVGEEDAGKVATFLTVTLSCDHRVIDGATGARFLQSFKNIVQHPGRLLL